MKTSNPFRVLIATILIGANSVGAQVTLTNLYSFPGGNVGDNPIGIREGTDGNYYGTTYLGGTNGLGTVYRLTPGGSLTSLHSFTASEGQNPVPQFIDTDGNLYGTTFSGGANGFGTVFRITRSGSFTNLHSFTASEGTPSGLVQGSDGNFYGTASGGANLKGLLFRMSPNGTVSNLFSFNGTNGSGPAGFWLGPDGNLYGITSAGGSSANCVGGCGTVFSISLGGSFSSLYSFTGGTNGASPPGIVPANDGNIYGTTFSGGANSLGLVFRIGPGGIFTNLHSFGAGEGQFAALGVQGSDGNLYGFTAIGGANNRGTVFCVTPSGSYSNLHSFTASEGNSPNFVVQFSDGAFYGTTGLGGTNNHGTVFKLSVPLNPPANQITSVQVLSTNVVATVASLSGYTYQLQQRDSLVTGIWSNILGASNKSIGGSLTVTNFNSTSQMHRFYRFSITP